MMFAPAELDVMTGTPLIGPSVVLTFGNVGSPSALCRALRTKAFASLMISTTPAIGMLAVTNDFSSVAMSTSGSVVAGMPVTPLVIDAGRTPAVSVIAGSMNWASMNCEMPAIISSRKVCSADGSELRASSTVNVRMPAILYIGSETVENVSMVTGFGAPSPTQAYVPPAVCRGTETLNGTRRSPGILPMRVAGRSSSMNSAPRDCAVGTSAPANGMLATVAGDEAALSSSSTSGEESRHQSLA